MGAFADDIGVVAEAWTDLSVILVEFEKFSRATNLWLNCKKTVIVPLGTYENVANARVAFENECPRSKDCTIADTAKYLGIWLGPNAESRQWIEQSTKYMTRTDRWHAAGSGPH